MSEGGALEGLKAEIDELAAMLQRLAPSVGMGVVASGIYPVAAAAGSSTNPSGDGRTAPGPRPRPAPRPRRFTTQSAFRIVLSIAQPPSNGR